MLASLIIFPQRASCALMKSPNSSGVEENPSKPIFLNCAWVSRAVDDLAQRAVELGHDLRRRAGRRDEARPGVEIEALMPASSIVGRSGTSALRWMRGRASGGTVPALTCGIVALTFSIRNLQRSWSVCFCSSLGVDGSLANALMGPRTVAKTRWP